MSSCSASLPKLFSAEPAEPAEGDARVDEEVTYSAGSRVDRYIIKRDIKRS